MLPWPPKNTKADTTLLSERVCPTLQPSSMPPKTGILAPPWRLLLHLGGDHHTTIGLEVRQHVVIGRRDPLAGFTPDLDLTPYGGKEHGVSRRHAVIVQDEAALYVKDLNTTNGTRINGFQLEPERLYRLRDGDELELGRLRMIVRFVRAPY